MKTFYGIFELIAFLALAVFLTRPLFSSGRLRLVKETATGVKTTQEIKPDKILEPIKTGEATLTPVNAILRSWTPGLAGQFRRYDQIILYRTSKYTIIMPNFQGFT